jgi:hypothetical protein
MLGTVINRLSTSRLAISSRPDYRGGSEVKAPRFAWARVLPTDSIAVPVLEHLPAVRKLLVVVVFVAWAAIAAPLAFAEAGFARAGDMGGARWSFAVVSLPDGRVLVASSMTAELFDPVSETFSPAGNLSTDRGVGLSGTLLGNGKVLLVGGQAGDSSQDSAEVYDPASGSFTPTGSMSSPRSFHTATLLSDGRVLVAGGHVSNHPGSALATAEIYDPVSGTFAPTGSMSVARQDQTATLLADGRVLVTGGYNDSPFALASAEIYDPAAGVFTPVSDMAVGRGNHTATLLGDGEVLVAGGHTGFPGESTAIAELFDPLSGGFTTTGALTSPRGAHTATVLPGGTVLVAGGFTAFPFLGETLSSAEIYDPSTGSFAPTASMRSRHGRHAAASLPDGDVLVAGGLNECCETAAAEVYMLSLVDTLPPRITVPAEIVTVAFEPAGAVVFYDVSAVDNIDDNPQLTCDPSSGATFALGTTVVTCTAMDATGNTATASFKVTVLPPLDITLVLARFGSVDPPTGVASIRGSISCNRETWVYIAGELKQTIARRAVVSGSFSIDVLCAPPATLWVATVTPTNGRYIAGKAVVSATAFSCDQFSCDFDQPAESPVTLRG